jgi:hypothetical protein
MRLEKTRGEKNKGMFHYVIENTWRKNVQKEASPLYA